MENKVDCLGVPTSCHQINQQFQSGKDRNDVDKAFEEWIQITDLNKMYSMRDRYKAFAKYFAERVKGGPL